MLPEAVSGRSFRGCLLYVSHDKDGANTSERVAWTEVRNLRSAPDDPEKVAKEMAWVWYHAPELKRAAGEKLTGRKMESPVYHLMLAWHPSQEPSRREMVMAAYSLLDHMGLGEHQAYLAAHNDEPHTHLHIVVNKCHPVRGIGAKLSNDYHRLQKWAYEYEKATGQIFCKERIGIYEDDPEIRKAAQHEELKKREAEREGQQKPSRNRGTHWAEDGVMFPNAAPAKEIRKQLSQQARQLEAQNKAMVARHKAELSGLYRLYAECKSMLWQTRGSVIGTTLDEMKALQKPEWREFFSEQRRQLEAFERNERTLAGQLANMVKVARMISADDWKTRALECLVAVASSRERMITVRGLQQQAVQDKGTALRRARQPKIARITQVHAEEIAKLRAIYMAQKDKLKDKHAREVATHRSAWRAHSKARRDAWSGYKRDEQHRMATAQRARSELAKQFHPKPGTGKTKQPQKAAEQNNTRDVGRIRTRGRDPT